MRAPPASVPADPRMTLDGALAAVSTAGLGLVVLAGLAPPPSPADDLVALVSWPDWTLIALVLGAVIAAVAYDCGRARADALWAERMRMLDGQGAADELDARLFAAFSADDAGCFEAVMRARLRRARQPASRPGELRRRALRDGAAWRDFPADDGRP